MTFNFLGMDFGRYVSNKIAETVGKTSPISSIVDRQVEIKLLDSNNKFSKMLNGINFTGEKVVVSDEYGLIFDGYVRSGKKSKGNFILSCESKLAPYMRSHISTEQINVNPIQIIENVLLSFGLSNYIDTGSFSVSKAEFSNVYCNAFARSAQNLSLSDFINQVGGLAGINIYYQRGKIYCSHLQYSKLTQRYITDRTFLDIPSLKYNEQNYTAYSVDYVGSGSTPLPATGGNFRTGKIWTQSTGAGNPIQVSDVSSAHNLGKNIVKYYGKIKKQISGTVDSNSTPIYLDDVYNISLPSISVYGLYRTVNYSRNKSTATVTLEEIL